MGSVKGRNGRDLTEAEDITKRWQEYTEELINRDIIFTGSKWGILHFNKIGQVTSGAKVQAFSNGDTSSYRFSDNHPPPISGVEVHKWVLIGHLLVAADLSGHVTGKEIKNFSCELEILLLSLCSVICASWCFNHLWSCYEVTWVPASQVLLIKPWTHIHWQPVHIMNCPNWENSTEWMCMLGCSVVSDSSSHFGL